MKFVALVESEEEFFGTEAEALVQAQKYLDYGAATVYIARVTTEAFIERKTITRPA